MIFTRDEIALIRQGKLNAALAPASQKLKADRTRPLRRRIMRHDADGQEQGWTTETVYDTTPDGDRRPVIVTILAVTELAVTELTMDHAKRCGYRTPIGLKDAWQAKYPKANHVKFVEFQIGDVRDRDVFLNYSGAAGGDYTGNPARALDRDAPVLSPELLAPYTKAANERDRARATGGLGQDRDEIAAALGRMRARLKEAPNRDLAKNVRAMEHQLASMDRKLKAA